MNIDDHLNDEFSLIGNDVMDASCLRYDGKNP